MKKFVYMFSEGNADMREILGGKGANLCEMTNLKIPVPQGFIVSTEACNSYYDKGKQIDKLIEKQIFACLKNLETITGKIYGDYKNPLLLSIRSGARVSMPGMMDSVLNLGLNDRITESLALITKNDWFAFDCYRRFIQMYANVVKGIKLDYFEEIISNVKNKNKIKEDSELTVSNLKTIINEFKEVYKKQINEEFPQNTKHQLIESIKAVFNSWNNARAITYRKINDIPNDWGTAVNVQQMVFGNMGKSCCTGVAFSRNPNNGDNVIYGEYLTNAQGEDIVNGSRTAKNIDELRTEFPGVYEQFSKYVKILEKRFKDMQEIEFTLENNKLYILQTRNGKRTPSAMLNIAISLVKEKQLTKQEALLNIDTNSIQSLLHNQFDSKSLNSATIIGNGLPASPGCSSGKVVFTTEKAIELSKNKQPVILVRQETSAEDIQGMHVSQGILTAIGGMTSHAAVIARGMGIPCVVGTANLSIKTNYFNLNGKRIKEGDFISIDGSTGNIYVGEIPTEPCSLSNEFKTIMKWTDEFSTLKVLANADNPHDAQQAFKFGAEGIGLCRTEHMFFEKNRIKVMRQMILSNNDEERKIALEKLYPFQKNDFIELFKEMHGYPVTIRLLDPPLHEFLPKGEKEIKELAEEMSLTVKDLKAKIDELKEVNPMMGHRGCRLDITYPEIAQMQTKAIIESALEVKEKYKINVKPEIMIPLIVDLKEYEFVKNIIDKTAKEILSKSKTKINYLVGTMIETPRAAILAGEIASKAEFFSFGTNDLTQLSFGFSRDDSGKFLQDYYDNSIFEIDPFAQIDENGVGALIKMAVDKAKLTNKNIVLGICGEHGGNPKSIDFCHRAGLTYVSCSPYRVPVAKLACAQAYIRNKK